MENERYLGRQRQKRELPAVGRRDFLRLATGTVAAGGIAAALVGCNAGKGSGSVTADASTDTVLGWTGVDFERDVDALVIGAGPSGLFAAYAIASAGKDVLVIDKQASYGGDAANAANDFMLAYSNVCADVWPEQAQTMDERKEKLHKYFPDEAVYATQLHFAEGAVECFDLMFYDWGCEYNLELNYGPYKGMFYPKDGIGEAAENWSRVFDNVQKAGAQFAFNTKAEHFIVDPEGVIVGLRAYDKANERWTDIRAKQFVLATGGFASNAEMVAQYYPEWTSIGCVTTQATGDGFKLGQSVGGALSNMFAAPTNLNADTEVIFLPQMFGRSFSILPNGKRFYNEVMVHDSAANCMANGYFEWIAVFDDEIRQGPNKKQVDKGGDEIFTGNTVEELAAAMNYDATLLQAAFDNYDAICEAGVDEEFGRTLHLEKLQPPYYAYFNHPVRYKTSGGFSIDDKTRVLKEDGQPVGNLYACGIVGGTTDIPPACGSGLYTGKCVVEALA